MPARDLRPLARCHGFVVLADDGRFGEIATPIFPPRVATPDYLVVTTTDPRRPARRAVVPVALVRWVDESARTVRLNGRREDLEQRLPASLPLSGR
jgi:hypothetical protein